MITTKEPDESMLEVAIASINAVCEEGKPGSKIVHLSEETRFEYPHVWELPQRKAATEIKEGTEIE